VKNRSFAILLLISIAWHSLLGPLPAVASVCLGGGHVHEVDDEAAVDSGCEIACQHDLGFPVPLPVEKQADNCGCTDIEIAAIDLLTAVRHGADWPAALAPAPVCEWLTPPLGFDSSLRGPPFAIESNPGMRQQLGVVQNTRLLL
jgi:hypothetical protein